MIRGSGNQPPDWSGLQKHSPFGVDDNYNPACARKIKYADALVLCITSFHSSSITSYTFPSSLSGEILLPVAENVRMAAKRRGTLPSHSCALLFHFAMLLFCLATFICIILMALATEWA